VPLPCTLLSVYWLRRFHVLMLVLAAVVWPHLASARTSGSTETRVGIFDVARSTLIGVQSLRTPGNHRANAIAYGENASGCPLAAEGAGEGLLNGGGKVLRHYTDAAGYEAIMESGMLRAPTTGPTAGRVFATELAGDAQAIESRIFGNFPTHAGRGSHVIEFTPKQGVTFQLGKPGELYYRGGALRFGRHIEVNFAGPNPY